MGVPLMMPHPDKSIQPVGARLKVALRLVPITTTFCYETRICPPFFFQKGETGGNYEIGTFAGDEDKAQNLPLVAVQVAPLLFHSKARASLKAKPSLLFYK